MSKYTEENPFNLTSKQLQFCEAYLFHEDCRFNGSASAKLAGYSEKTAKQIASLNLSKVDIIKHLAYLEDKFSKELQKRTAKDAADILNLVINKDYEMEYSPVNMVAALELSLRLHDRFPKKTLPIHGPEGETIEVSEGTQVVFVLPNERPLPQMPSEEKPPEVKPVVKEEKKDNPVKQLILQTLKKGVKP